MKFTPHPNRVMIKPIQEDSFDVEALEEKGTVLAVGSDCKFLKVGDTVYFDSWGIGRIKIGEEKFYILQEKPEFILGKENGPKKQRMSKRMDA